MAKLLSTLPNGALLKFGKHQINTETAQHIIWTVVDKNHTGYPANSVSLITQNIIDLRAYDAEEVSADGETTIDGNTRYEHSNIHQWLNSSASAGAWYKASHTNDNPPSNSRTRNNTGYDTRAGFLYNFTTAEKNALLSTTLKTQKSNTFGTVTAKVFLPSMWETLGTHTVVDDSSRFSYFTTNSFVANLTAQAFTNTLSTYKPGAQTTNWMYMTRNNYGASVYSVDYNGTVIATSPNEGALGVRPVINLSANTKISDTTDSDGCYTVLTQSLPTISGSDSNLGGKGNYYTKANGFPATIGFTQTYTVNDADTSDSITVTEYLDNEKVRSYVATKNATNTFDVTGNTWLNLSNGVHTMKITATDGFDTATRTYTFTKSVGLFVVQRDTPIEASNMPTNIIVTVVKTIPDGATMTVEVCNNGFDTKPTWQTVQPGEIIEFSNKSKTATKWGVNIRVTVERNGAEGACFITEIGGNFK